MIIPRRLSHETAHAVSTRGKSNEIRFALRARRRSRRGRRVARCLRIGVGQWECVADTDPHGWAGADRHVPPDAHRDGDAVTDGDSTAVAEPDAATDTDRNAQAFADHHRHPATIADCDAATIPDATAHTTADSVIGPQSRTAPGRTK